MRLFVNPYNLSIDYERLFQLLCENKEIAAFIDYKSIISGIPSVVSRDICTIRRFEEFLIQISARGISYGGLYGYEHTEYNEKDLFIAVCKSLNLGWFDYLSDELD